MFKQLVLLLALCCLAFGLKTAQIKNLKAPVRPNPPETFEMRGTVETEYQGKHHIGEGGWAIDTSAGKGVEDYQFVDRENIFVLQRYDLHFQYVVESSTQKCQKTALTGSDPGAWSWLKNATYKGDKKIFHQTFDLWEATIGPVTLGLAVDKNDPNRPAWFSRVDSSTKFAMQIFQFYNKVSNQSWFDVPKVCASAKAPTPPTKYGADPPRPSIAEAFEARVGVQLHKEGKNTIGGGVWVVDQPKGEAMEFYEFDKAKEMVYDLQRYDMKEEFQITSQNKSLCTKKALTGKMGPIWGWVAQATYEGQKTILHRVFDLWQYKTGGVTLGVAVDKFDPNTPAWFGEETSSSKLDIEFFGFETNYINVTLFNVPPECH